MTGQERIAQLEAALEQAEQRRKDLEYLAAASRSSTNAEKALREHYEARLAEAEARAEQAERERESWKQTAEVLQEPDTMAALFTAEKERADEAEARLAAVPALVEAAEIALREWEAWVDDELMGTRRYQPEKQEIARKRAALAAYQETTK